MLNRRKYLTPAEVERLITVAKQSKTNGHRNGTMVLLAFRHGLRVSELSGLQWSQIDFELGTLHVHRLKAGIDTVHPLGGTELRSLKRLRRDNPNSRFVFLSNRGTPMTRQAFYLLLKDLGVEAGIEVPVHPHMIRHATGYKLANQGVDTRTLQHFLGHKNIQNTVIYTQLNANRFNNFWGD